MEKHLKEAIQILDLSAHPELNEVRVYLNQCDPHAQGGAGLSCFHFIIKRKEKSSPFQKGNSTAKCYVAGRGMLRVLIGECLNLFPNEIELVDERFGKPYLKGYRDSFQFNLSNSGKFIAIAIHPGEQQIGIDLEAINKQFEYWEIAGPLFHLVPNATPFIPTVIFTKFGRKRKLC